MRYYDIKNLKRYMVDIEDNVKDEDLKILLLLSVRYAWRYPKFENAVGRLSILDLIQYGNIGIVQGLKNLDEERFPGERMNYMKMKIKFGVKDAVNKTSSDIRIPANQLYKSKEEILADKVLSQLFHSTKMYNWKTHINIDSVVHGGMNSSTTADKRAYAITEEYEIATEIPDWKKTIELGADLLNIMDKLPAKQRVIIDMSFGITGDQYTQEEISDDLKISMQAVRKGKKEALKTLNTPENKEFLKEYFHKH